MTHLCYERVGNITHVHLTHMHFITQVFYITLVLYLYLKKNSGPIDPFHLGFAKLKSDLTQQGINAPTLWASTPWHKHNLHDLKGLMA